MRDYQGDWKEFEQILIENGLPNKIEDLHNLAGLTHSEIKYTVQIWIENK